jgi:hypothetical protein
LDEPSGTKTKPPAGIALNQQLARTPPKFSVPASRDKSKYPSVADRNSIKWRLAAICPQP